jgi:hypothetical protein
LCGFARAASLPLVFKDLKVYYHTSLIPSENVTLKIVTLFTHVICVSLCVGWYLFS